MEQWRPIPDWPTYEVSDQGRVRSAARAGSSGPRSRRLSTAKGGRAENYRRVMLTQRVNGKRRRRHAYLHHIVLEAFVGARPEGAVACHRNDDGDDNALANLYWGSEEDNQLDKYINSLDLASTEEAPF